MIDFFRRFNRPFIARILAGATLIIALSLQCIGAWTDSQTTDEGAHLGAGLSYWRTGDFRLNPEHPPLVKLLAALPLLPNDAIQPSQNATYWANRDQWEIGRLILYHQLTPSSVSQMALWLARLPVVLLWLGLGVIVWKWAEERTSAWGGAVSTILFAFEPTLLGHGHLITTDVAIATGFTATFWLTTKIVDHPNWRLVSTFALIFGLTQITKFSALILWPVAFGLLGLAAWQASSSWTWLWWRRTLALTILIGAGLTWGIYGFERQSANADPRIDRLWQERDALAGSTELTTMPPIVRYLVRATPPGSAWRERLQAASTIPIPAYSYWRGAFAVASHNAMGHAAYLLGEQRSQGWWYYFPIALAVKTPLPLIGLVLLLMVNAIRSRRSLSQPHQYLLYGPVILYLLWSFTSHINIGVRHVIPMIPLTIVAVASLVPSARKIWQRLMLVGLTTAMPIVALAAWPNTIGYFNAFAGGTRGGHRIILDSNLDWNQDLWRLRDYLEARSVPPAMIALFGSVPIEVAHPHPQRIPTDVEVAAQGQPRELIIISKGILYSVDLPFTWLRDLKPTDRIGSSILVFDLR